MIMIRTEFKKLYPREEIIVERGINIKYVSFLEDSLCCAEDELIELKDSLFYKVYKIFRRN